MEGDTHKVIEFVQGSLGGSAVRIGQRGQCRYCGTTDARSFRHVAHAVPEALGNKWIETLDECDACNDIFSRYEDSLAKVIGPILTLGGTRGKRNAVRQTGRSGGVAVIRHDGAGKDRRLSVFVQGTINDHVGINPNTGELVFAVPVAPERFIPRHAYKALVKMGLGLLPLDELKNFDRLRRWVLGPNDQETFADLVVGISFGAVGNAPALAAATLLKRCEGTPDNPYMVFVVSAGSVCFQIDLKSDQYDGGWPPGPSPLCGVKWSNVVGAPSCKKQIRIDYGDPIHLDWKAGDLQPSPLEKIIFNVHPATGRGRVTPVWRSTAQPT